MPLLIGNRKAGRLPGLAAGRLPGLAAADGAAPQCPAWDPHVTRHADDTPVGTGQSGPSGSGTGHSDPARDHERDDQVQGGPEIWTIRSRQAASWPTTADGCRSGAFGAHRQAVALTDQLAAVVHEEAHAAGEFIPLLGHDPRGQ